MKHLAIPRTTTARRCRRNRLMAAQITCSNHLHDVNDAEHYGDYPRSITSDLRRYWTRRRNDYRRRFYAYLDAEEAAHE